MGKLILSKVLFLLPVLVLVTFGTMVLLDLVPGHPAYALYGDATTPEQVQLVTKQLHLDQPLPVRYLMWVGDVFSGDLGTSFRTRQPVTEEILNRLPITLQITVMSLSLSLILAIPLGTYAAYRRNRAADRVIQLFNSVSISSPGFLTGVFLAYLLAVKWQVFPVTGWRPISDGIGPNLKYAFLPALTIALPQTAILARLLRTDMVGVLQEDYILAARSSGLSNRYVLFRHALRPASFSLLTLLGLALGNILAGSVIVEYLFGLPGIGTLLLASIEKRDFVMLQGVVAFVAINYVIVNTLVDVAYSIVDPRLQRSGARA